MSKLEGEGGEWGRETFNKWKLGRYKMPAFCSEVSNAVTGVMIQLFS